MIILSILSIEKIVNPLILLPWRSFESSINPIGVYFCECVNDEINWIPALPAPYTKTFFLIILLLTKENLKFLSNNNLAKILKEAIDINKNIQPKKIERKLVLFEPKIKLKKIMIKVNIVTALATFHKAWNPI